MDGKIVERIESVFMDANDYSPIGRKRDGSIREMVPVPIHTEP